MNSLTTEEQTALGSKSVDRDIEALRTAMQSSGESGLSHEQLAETQSKTRILKRHLDRLFDLEEVDDYFQFVVGQHPQLSQQVTQLKTEHEEFRQLIDRLIMQLGSLETHDQERFDAICLEIHSVICRVLAHGRAEGKLLRQSLDRDEGGEG